MPPTTQSVIWTYFIPDSQDPNIAKCNICLKNYSRKGRTTTSLKNHLKSMHPEEYASFLSFDSEFQFQKIMEDADFTIMSDEIEALIRAMEERPGLTSGKNSAEFPTSYEQKQGWDAVALHLSSSGFDKFAKSGPDVRKKWMDLKYRVKKKANALDKMAKEGLSEIPHGMALNNLEERVLAMIKQTCSLGGDFPDSTYSVVPSPTILPHNEDEPLCSVEISELPTLKSESREANESASDCSMDVSADRVSLTGRTPVCNGSVMSQFKAFKRRPRLRVKDERNFSELYSLRKEKLEIRRQALSIKRQTLELEKQKLELIKQQLAVQTNTLDELKKLNQVIVAKSK